MDLDLLSLADAMWLLRALIGTRAARDPAATRAVAVHCSRLPLALRVAAERVGARPSVDLADLAAELTDEQRRLDLLEAEGDPRTAVRAVFSWSYRQLAPGPARMFRLAALHPGTEIDAGAAAAFAGTTLDQAGDMLELLARAQLLQRTLSGRYGLHDLLRAYGRELAHDEDGEEELTAALTRLLEYYLQTAAGAMDVLFPAERHRRPRVTRSGTLASPITSPAAARAWLDAERECLVAVTVHAALRGWPGHATRMATTLFRYLDAGGYFSEAVTIHSHARQAARAEADCRAEAEALISLGVVAARQSCYEQARAYIQRSVPLFREVTDLTGQARALSNLGFVEFQQGHHERAAEHLRQSLALHRTLRDPVGEARAVSNLGLISVQHGRYEQAVEYFGQALAVYGKNGDQPGEAHALANLGEIDLQRGHYEEAESYLRRSLALCQVIGDPIGAAGALINLGLIDIQRGRYDQAISQHREAMVTYRKAGDRYGEAVARNGLGVAFLAAGRPDDANIQHTAALSLASDIGDRYQQGRAHNGLGHVHRAQGTPDQALRHWHRALALYTQLGVPEAGQVRALVNSLNGTRPGVKPEQSARRVI